MTVRTSATSGCRTRYTSTMLTSEVMDRARMKHS